MEAFPFSEANWSRVKEAALPVVNAGIGETRADRAFHLEGLRRVLWELRQEYGEHPVLLETEADFVDDPVERRDLYERAARVAADNGLPTLSIRLDLARVLLDEFGQPDRAAEALRACEPELGSHADDADCELWAELRAMCERRLGDS